jgi:hypothetical protein
VAHLQRRFANLGALGAPDRFPAFVASAYPIYSVGRGTDRVSTAQREIHGARAWTASDNRSLTARLRKQSGMHFVAMRVRAVRRSRSARCRKRVVAKPVADAVGVRPQHGHRVAADRGRQRAGLPARTRKRSRSRSSNRCWASARHGRATLLACTYSASHSLRSTGRPAIGGAFR